MSDSRSNRELRIESASIGANPNFIKPYNLAGRYGCEYYITHSEISHEVYMSDLYDHNFSKANISTKPRDLKIRENIFTRIKRRLTSSKDTNIGGDGSGGGKACPNVLSGNDPLSENSSGGDGGGGDVMPNTAKSEIRERVPCETGCELGVSIKGGDMGGGGAQKYTNN